MEDNQATEKLEFLQRYSDELKPVLGDSEKDVFNRIVEGIATNEEVDQAAEAFETKIYTRAKEDSEFDPDAKRVLVTIADPGAFNVAKPLIDELSLDRRVRYIKVFTHGVAQKSFTASYGDNFEQKRSKDDPVLDDLNEDGPIDVALATVSADNGPESVAFYGAKSVLGAQKLYMIRDGWAGVGSSFEDGSRAKNMDEIDGIFCPDELSGRVVLEKLPNYPRNKIYTFGTPTVDSVYTENGVELQRIGREKLGLGDGAVAILYGGGIQSEWIERWGTDPQIEAKTFSEVVEAMREVAQGSSDKNYVLLFRPHPRDPDKESIYDTSGVNLPSNLQIIPATSPTVSPSEAIYASDLDLTISSTETFKNILRSRPAVFLTLEGDEMGEGMMKRVLGADAYHQLATQQGVEFIRDKQDLIKLISGIERKISTKKPQAHESSVGRILDIALS